MNEGIMELMRRIDVLRKCMQNQAMAWDSSRPVFFFLEEAIDAAGKDVERMALQDASERARKQLQEIGNDTTRESRTSETTE